MDNQKLYEAFTEHPLVCTDSRKIEIGSIFFALKGENFNGNAFAQEALRAGAALSVVDEPAYASHDRCWLVPDCLSALQELARYHRSQLNIPVLAITGSNGKTTTKELTAAVLSHRYRTVATEGNLNNHIGVPLTLLRMNRETGFGVVEMGANHRGEIALLCSIARPDHGLITNVGSAHLEGFGGPEGVRLAKRELYDFLASAGSTVFINSDHSCLAEMAEEAERASAGKRMKRIYYGTGSQADCRGRVASEFPYMGVHCDNPDMVISTRLAGSYNLENVLAAVCIGNHFGVPVHDIREAIESYRPSMNRSQVLEKGGNTFIMDAYNANPTSMRMALEHFGVLPGKHKIAVLGDMLELGSYAGQEHRSILQQAMQGGFEKVILVGELFGRVTAPPCLHFNDVTALREWFREQRFKGYTILVKGSRKTGLERLVED